MPDAEGRVVGVLQRTAKDYSPNRRGSAVGESHPLSAARAAAEWAIQAQQRARAACAQSEEIIVRTEMLISESRRLQR